MGTINGSNMMIAKTINFSILTVSRFKLSDVSAIMVY